ncbi:hypothetical protein ACSBR2_005856 [Camellia fascicularis]
MVFWGSLSDPEEMAQDDEANQDDEAKHITRENVVQACRGGVGEPFATESRKYLRKLSMGKDVIFKVDYTVPFIGQEFGSVFLGDKNVALMVVSDGWVKVREQGQ